MLGLNLLENYSLFKAAYSSFTEKVSEKYGISKTEFDILLFLANNTQFDTAAEIVEMKHLAKSHVSVLVSRLEDAGYITRFFAAGNHKTVHIRLTDKAYPIIEEGRKAQMDFAAMLLEGISEEQLNTTRVFVETARANVDNYLRKNG